MNDVHVGASCEAFNMEVRSAEKFMDVSVVNVLTKMVSVPQHDHQSKHQDYAYRISMVLPASAFFCTMSALAWNTGADDK